MVKGLFMSLERSIGTWGLFLVALGGMIGSGWLFGAFYAARFAGPAAIFSWVIGGVMMMVVALTFAELASAFPLSGGTVRFLQLTHGPLVNYGVAWIGWVSAIAVAPIETMALIQYADNYFPGLMTHLQDGHTLSRHGLLLAVFLMLLLCVLNSMGGRFLSKTNAVVVTFKIVVPILTMLVLFSTCFHLSNFTQHGFNPFGLKAVLTALPAAGVIFSFIGYAPAIQLAGEAKNPQRSIPIAIIGSLGCAIVLYVSLQVCFIGAVSPAAFAKGWGGLSFLGDVGPFAALALSAGAVWLSVILFADAAISPFGTAFIYTASTARIAYAMGESQYLPRWFMRLNRHNMPVRLIMLNFCLGLLLFLPFPSWQKLVGFLVSALVFSYAVGPLALPILRKTMPDQPRPFSLPYPNVLSLLAFYVCNLILYWTGWHTISKIVIALAIGYVLFFCCYRGLKQLAWRQSGWFFLYVALLAVISCLGDFEGGLHVIRFGWDFLAVAVMSALIFTLARYFAVAPAAH